MIQQCWENCSPLKVFTAVADLKLTTLSVDNLIRKCLRWRGGVLGWYIHMLVMSNAVCSHSFWWFRQPFWCNISLKQLWDIIYIRFKASLITVSYAWEQEGFLRKEMPAQRIKTKKGSHPVLPLTQGPPPPPPQKCPKCGKRSIK